MYQVFQSTCLQFTRDNKQYINVRVLYFLEILDK